MSYITQADIEMRFGADNVRAWSDLEGSGQAHAERIAQAIAAAKADIETRLRGRGYLLPLRNAAGETPTEVQDWAVNLAALWLYELRGRDGQGGKEFADLRRRVDRELDEVVAGIRRLSAQRHRDSGGSQGPTVAMD